MNPFVKKVVAAVAVKEAIEKVQEMRRPKPSVWSRLAPFALLAAIGGALFYLNKSGKLSPVVDQVKGKAGSGGSGSNGSSAWDGGSTAPTPSTTAPPPTV
jgi:hypothetical protein